MPWIPRSRCTDRLTTLLIQLMALMFIFALATGGAAWIIGSDRVLAVAGYDGGFAGYFGVFHDRWGRRCG